MPRFITNTNLVVISKKEKGKYLEDLRPISLCNFVNKIFSRLILEWLSYVVPKIISKNQSGFVKDRSIAENILLAEKIIRDIGKRNKFFNVMVKLGMTKAYDRVS